LRGCVEDICSEAELRIHGGVAAFDPRQGIATARPDLQIPLNPAPGDDSGQNITIADIAEPGEIRMPPPPARTCLSFLKNKGVLIC